MTSPAARLRRLQAEVASETAANEAKRRVRQTALVFLDEKHGPQTTFLRDAARLKCALCTRRAGKTYGNALWLLEGAATTPKAASLYISITRDSAKRNFWIPCLKPAAEHAGLVIVPPGPKALRHGECRANETELSLTLWNGHVIYVLGMDASAGERRKLLGMKLRRVVIDEAQDFVHVDLEKMVFGDLKPALADLRGELAMTGTPSDVQHGLFYELTKEQDPGKAGTWSVAGWSGHRWSAADNPYMAAQWAEEIADLIRANPLIQETPTFQQNYRGRWVINPDNLVYRYMPERNDWDGVMPQAARGGWHYVLGVDLGWGATSFTLKAYHDNLRELRILESWRRPEMDVTATSSQIKAYEAYAQELGGELETTQIDGANRQAVEEMRARHGVSVTAAEKRDKFDFIRLMNDDLIQGYIKVSVAPCSPADLARRGLPPGADATMCGDLVAEWKKLVRDPRKLAAGTHEEQRGLPNHCADGALYGWRYCYQYLSTPLTERPKPGTVEAAKQEADEMETAAEEAWRAQQPEPEPVEGLDSSNWESGWETW